MQDWFTAWFNTPYYHLLYKDRDHAEARNFIDRLIRRINLPQGSKVLDLACGKGRHSLQLSNNGFQVIGIDLSPESIAEAELSSKDGLDFFVHDMRELYWSEHFDLVVNLFTSFGYFHNEADDQKTISSVAEALKANGIFVLDFLNAVKVKNNLVRYEEKTLEGIRFQISRELSDGMIVKKIHIIDGDIELDFREEVDALEYSHLVRYFAVAGLELVDTFGNYQLDDFDEETSDRLILMAKKITG